MIKKLFITIFIFCLWTSCCFAEDIYIGQTDEYTAYYRPESTSATFTVYPGKVKDFLNIKCSIIMMPTEDKLEKLKRQAIDDRIEYCKYDCSASVWYNRVEEKYDNWIPFVACKRTLWGNGKQLYTYDHNKDINLLNDNPNSEICIKTLNEAILYMNSHKELIKTVIH